MDFFPEFKVKEIFNSKFVVFMLKNGNYRFISKFTYWFNYQNKESDIACLREYIIVW